MDTLPSVSNALLNTAGIRNHRTEDRAESKRHAAMDAMRFASTRMLMIDEMNHLTHAGKDAGRLLAEIKNARSGASNPTPA